MQAWGEMSVIGAQNVKFTLINKKLTLKIFVKQLYFYLQFLFVNFLTSI